MIRISAKIIYVETNDDDIRFEYFLMIRSNFLLLKKMSTTKEKQQAVNIVEENGVQDEAEFEAAFTPIQKLEVCCFLF